MTLVIMAAGMGSRFGGLKQIEPFGPNGEFIIDYSIYDAIRAGFNKIVFVIRKENYDIFRKTIGKRIENIVEVEYAFQEFDTIPINVKLPESRVKPLGTAHAIACCKKVVDSNFALINSDDFYGYDALKKAYEFLNSNECNGMVAYQIGKTLTENGSVKRGCCESINGYLTNIIESSVKKENDKIVASPLDGSKSFYLDSNDLCSMNLFCFKKDMIDYMYNNLEKFLENNKNNLENVEYLIPDVVLERIKLENFKLKIINTDSTWMGVTYKEDKKFVVERLNNLIELGEYPNNLYK
ncbi:MAG: sugar phosphate nucleotidyltransferase [bacterium]|nr:sugar phosphate nucleotidyltransferase [bacterium]